MPPFPFETTRRSIKDATMRREPGGGLKRTSIEQSSDPGNASQLHVRGRGQVAAPQGLVLSQAIVSKTEDNRRMGRNSNKRPGQLYAAPTRDRSVFNTYKGTIGLCMIKPGSTFRGGLGNNPTVAWTHAANGLAKDEPLGIPAVAQVDRDATNANSEDRTALVLHGVQTILNLSHEVINIGDRIYLDPNPATVRVDGRIVPAITVEGISKETFFFQTRPLKANTCFAMERELVNRARVRMGTIGEVLTRACKNGDAREIYTALDKVCQDVFDEDGGPAMGMPIRDHVRISVFDMLVNMACIPGALGRAVPDDHLTTVWVLAMQALLECLRLFASERELLYRDFADTLPMHLQQTPLHITSNKESIHSDGLTKLLSAETFTTTTITPTLRLQKAMEANARLHGHVQHCRSIATHGLHAYLARYYVGKALSSATKGAPFDVLLG